MVFSVLVAFFLIAPMSSNLLVSSQFLIGEQPKVTRSHVREAGWLLNERNAITCQKYLDGMCCLCWYIVVK